MKTKKHWGMLMKNINRVVKIGLLTSAILMTGCANFQTVDRTTDIPARVKQDDSGQPQSSQGKAIHLDAQQRLVIVNGLGKYCAEPSPDGLAAYAASLGLGVSNPTQVGGSISQALQSSAASIGLRTQSITLMRDALYRICEAQSNGSINDVQASMLLRRNQDLMAGIVAIEQLTGVVRANQVVINQSASSNSTAMAVATQKIIAAQEKEIADIRKRIENLEKDISKLVGEIKQIETDIGNATAAPAISQLQGQKAQKESEKTMKENTLKAESSLLVRQQSLLDEMRNKQDSWMASSSAISNGSGYFNNDQNVDNVDSQSVSIIAGSVERIIDNILSKDYTYDSCINIVVTNDSDVKWIKDMCMKLMSSGFFKKVDGVDYHGYIIKTALDRQVVTKESVEKWIKGVGKKVDVDDFISKNEFSGYRVMLVRDFNL